MEQAIRRTGIRERTIIGIGGLALIGTVAIALVASSIGDGGQSAAGTASLGVAAGASVSSPFAVDEENQNPRQNPALRTIGLEVQVPVVEADDFNQNPRQNPR